jgi:phosphoserine phosphatase RsbU/P
MQSTTREPDISVLSLEEQVVRLQALLEATRQVHSTSSTELVLLKTVQILVRELELDGAAFVPSGATEPTACHGAPILPPFHTCKRFMLNAREGEPLGELLVSSPLYRDLSLYEEDFIQGLVLQVAVALENAVFHEKNLQWARVQQDLEAARTIQRSLLPKTMPTIAGYSLAARSVACYEVGGDYLDSLELEDGSFLFIVADVAGKGLASAIMATSFRSAFRSLAGQPMPLLEMVRRVNQQHWDEGSEARRRYVTAIFVRLDRSKECVEVVNAGHNPGVLLRPDGTSQWIDASGTPLGLLPGAEYAAEHFDFPPGSKLLLYTDGLTEVFHKEEEFGAERLLEVFQNAATPDAADTLDKIWTELQIFSTGDPQSDDMTAFAISHRTLNRESETR